MLQCGSSLRTFVHLAAFLLAETSVCGLSGLMQVRLLLLQHLLAVAVGFMLRCSPRRGSGHSMLPVSADSKLTFRRTMIEFTDCGLSGRMHVRLLLTQHFPAIAAGFLLRCGTCRQSSRSKPQTFSSAAKAIKL
jgi:hypothetical protein